METLDILLKLIPFTHKEENKVVFTTNLEFGDWIVTSIELLLMSIFLISTWKLWRSYKQDLKSTQLLCDETVSLKEKGFSYYNDFRNNLKKDSKIYHLWSEFDESLIKQNNQYENSLDADYFFNNKSLTSHVGSKYYSSIPGMLLGIGLLGTFFALYVALIELNLEGDGLKESIRVFIGMVGVKFTASVWGILLSVVFTFIEKILEGRLSEKIYNLQENIDSIFKRQTAEQNLFKIASESEQQTRAMNSLAETLTQKISEQFNPMLAQMNGHLEHMPLQISKAIGDSLAGPLSELKNNAKNAAESQSDSLETIVNTFISKLDQTTGDQINGIQTMMAETTQELTRLLSSIKEVSEDQNAKLADREAQMQDLFKRTMSSFEEQMGQVQNVFKTIIEDSSKANQEEKASQQKYLETERMAMLNQIDNISNTFKSLSTVTTENMQNMFNKQQESLSREKDDLSKKSEQVSEEIRNALVSMADQNSSRDKKLQEMMQMINNKHIELFDKNKEFATQMENSISKIMSDITQKVLDVQNIINATASKLSNVPSMLSSFESSSKNLSDFSTTAQDATKTLQGAVSELQQAQQSIKEQLEHIGSQTKSMENISSTTKEVVASSETSAKVMQETYKNLIEKNSVNVNQLGEAMSKWLSDYDKQVHSTMQNSLNQVQSSMSSFSNTVASSLAALEDAIESINNKIQS